MDDFKCERCDSRKFTVTRGRGVLGVQCISCGEEYWTQLRRDLYPWPAPEEKE